MAIDRAKPISTRIVTNLSQENLDKMVIDDDNFKYTSKAVKTVDLGAHRMLNDNNKVVENPEATRICIDCGEEKLISKYYSTGTVDKYGIPRRRKECIPCHAARKTAYKKFNDQDTSWMKLCEEYGLELWEKQPRETIQAFNAWVLYRDMYPGIAPTIGKVAAKLELPYTDIREWARRWNWKERLNAWVLYLDEENRQKKLDLKNALIERHLKVADAMQSKIEERLKRLDPNELEPHELARWVDLATKIERLSVGLSPDKGEVDTDAEKQKQQKQLDELTGKEIKSITPKDKVSEILGILKQSGAIRVEMSQKITENKMIATNESTEEEFVDIEEDEQEY